jgi:leucyl/phenylalanyl-tRNA--protein transferase
VVRACSHRRETWIDETIVQSYIGLHQAGHAHSLEIWRQGMLVGGLYGVVIGGAFFGESMFHRVADASKVALVTLVTRLKEAGFQLLDTQWTTPHLVQFGAVSISRREYLHRLQLAIRATPKSLW